MGVRLKCQLELQLPREWTPSFLAEEHTPDKEIMNSDKKGKISANILGNTIKLKLQTGWQKVYTSILIIFNHNTFLVIHSFKLTHNALDIFLTTTVYNHTIKPEKQPNNNNILQFTDTCIRLDSPANILCTLYYYNRFVLSFIVSCKLIIIFMWGDKLDKTCFSSTT